MIGWQDCLVEDIASNEKNSLATGPFGSAISSKYFVDDGIPVIRGGNLSADIGTRIIDDGFVFVTKDKAAEFYRSTVHKGDLIFTCWGTINQVGLIDGRSKYTEYIISNKQMKLTPDPQKADSLFLYYLFSGPEKQQEIINNGIGAAVPGFNLGQLRKMVLSLPCLPEQKAIAAVLSSLDDKIELFQRQNKTLEALAQTIFRHWFVDGAADEWEAQPLDKIATYLNGLACQNYPPENEVDKLPVLKIKDLRNGFSNQSDWATSNVPKEYIVEAGDVIFSWSGSLMVKIWDGRRCILNQHLFKITSEKFPKWFYYFWTNEHLQKFVAIAESKATTMGHIKRGDLSTSMVLVPPSSQLSEMDQAITPLIDKLILNNRQIMELTTMRDTLLPKLVSGEVRVKLLED